jgi:hypothetical protein
MYYLPCQYELIIGNTTELPKSRIDSSKMGGDVPQHLKQLEESSEKEILAMFAIYSLPLQR